MSLYSAESVLIWSPWAAILFDCLELLPAFVPVPLTPPFHTISSLSHQLPWHSFTTFYFATPSISFSSYLTVLSPLAARDPWHLIFPSYTVLSDIFSAFQLQRYVLSRLFSLYAITLYWMICHWNTLVKYVRLGSACSENCQDLRTRTKIFLTAYNELLTFNTAIFLLLCSPIIVKLSQTKHKKPNLC